MMSNRKSSFFDNATTMGRLLAFFVLSALCGALVVGPWVPGLALLAGILKSAVGTTDGLPDGLDTGLPGQTTQILAADGSLIAKVYFRDREPLPLDQISSHLRNAVIAVEDERFYEHGGVDPKGIVRAFTSTLTGDRQGASTLTQQYVNNLIFQNLEAQGRKEEVRLGKKKGILDKIKESKTSLALEAKLIKEGMDQGKNEKDAKKYAKDKILNGYLNLVNFSNGSYGAEKAAHFYFNKKAKDLSIAESALLAAIVNSPSAVDPLRFPQNAIQRRNMVLGKMRDQQKITQEQYAAAIASPLGVSANPTGQGCGQAGNAQFFCDYVQNIFLNDPLYGKTRVDRQLLLTQGGLKIKTTLDRIAQDKAKEQVDGTITPAELSTKNRGSALVSVEPGTGKVVAMAQNFEMSAEEGPGKTSYNFSVPSIDTDPNTGEEKGPLGGLGTMQPGSSIKPLTFAAWLDAGKSMNERLNGAQREYNMQWKNSCEGETTSSKYIGKDSLQNYGDTNYRTMTVLQGLAASVNTITFASAKELDFCRIKALATSMGLVDGQKREPLPLNHPSELLGSDSIDPLTMANFFATFSNKGTYCSPIAIDSITDQSGKEYPVPQSRCRQAVSPEVAAGVLYGIKRVLLDPIGSGMLIKPKVDSSKYDVGIKTGTSNKARDTWTVGTTNGLATAAWFGNPVGAQTPEYDNMETKIKNKLYKSLDGSDLAGTAFSNYMNAIASKYPNGKFPDPPERLGGPKPSPSPSPSPTSTQQGGGSSNQDSHRGHPNPRPTSRPGRR